MRSASFAGAIIRVWGQQGRYVRVFGVADKATGAVMRPDFYTRIASETKTFTVTAVLQLTDQARGLSPTVYMGLGQGVVAVRFGAETESSAADG